MDFLNALLHEFCIPGYLFQHLFRLILGVLYTGQLLMIIFFQGACGQISINAEQEYRHDLQHC